VRDTITLNSVSQTVNFTVLIDILLFLKQFLNSHLSWWLLMKAI